MWVYAVFRWIRLTRHLVRIDRKLAEEVCKKEIALDHMQSVIRPQISTWFQLPSHQYPLGETAAPRSRKDMSSVYF